MKILVVGGTRYFGKHLVRELIDAGYDVTIATRGLTVDNFGDRIKRIIFDRGDEESIKEAFQDKVYDVVYDSINYAPNDAKYLLDYLHTLKYIMVSSSAVYDDGCDITEDKFNQKSYPIQMGNRSDFSYQEGKRLAESVIYQNYHVRAITVRFPIVIGENDYTGRMKKYVDAIKEEKTVYVNNLDSKLSFIYEKTAGDFLAFLATVDFEGPINASSLGSIKMHELFNRMEEKIGKKLILDESGEPGAYNDCFENTVNIQKAIDLGFVFDNLHERIDEVLNCYLGETL